MLQKLPNVIHPFTKFSECFFVEALVQSNVFQNYYPYPHPSSRADVVGHGLPPGVPAARAEVEEAERAHARQPVAGRAPEPPLAGAPAVVGDAHDLGGLVLSVRLEGKGVNQNCFRT